MDSEYPVFVGTVITVAGNALEVYAKREGLREMGVELLRCYADGLVPALYFPQGFRLVPISTAPDVLAAIEKARGEAFTNGSQLGTVRMPRKAVRTDATTGTQTGVMTWGIHSPVELHPLNPPAFKCAKCKDTRHVTGTSHGGDTVFDMPCPDCGPML